ncbi:TonB-linked SusC/RagA family outer membrane protein [Christiangramia gaetbulicola]|uniref:TonB-linked SusC/RagA family outer membrane protein n=1 Tax=Christiangramia gaetbulicola TaxID=703340 RepID=A0A2T6AM06_9FLAO|nr:TonB-dependent receptor [Christiangramia gaetbulicola]PTX44848.1 TonB-linked SusC/RagA family outer membrane protein [Christiangramia gaetbulicola]
MRKFTCLLIVFLSGFFGAYAQSFSVSGLVSDENNMPLLGVNVIVKGESRGTTTDFDGNYTIENVSPGDVLQFSYVGFVAQEITINDQRTINVVLQTDSEALEEVVVIGYGTQQRKDITGAVSVVDNQTIDELQPIKVEQALQGTAAGVNVTPSSGAPGAGININIRGIASNSVNGPLVLIDGYQGDLNTLNPNDIESISILKDAQAAIYGVAGANGVVLVTTKTGKKNTAPKVTYQTYYGIQEASREIPVLNATEYALLLNESYANGGQDIPYPTVGGLGEGTDFQSEVFKQAPISNHNLSVTGGGERVTYSVGGSNLDQEGIVGGDKSGFKRNTARVSLGVDVNDYFDVQLNATYTNIARKSINENGLGSVLFNALNFSPTFGVNDQDLTGSLGNEIINPLTQIENTFNDYNLDKLNGNFSLDFTPIEELVFTSRIGYNLSKSDGKTFSPQIGAEVYGPGKVFNNPRSTVNQNRINDNSYTYDLFGTYEDRYNEDHHITATGGMTVIRQWGDGLYATGYDVPNNSYEFADISLTTGTNDGLNNSSYVYDIRKLSFFGRLQYDFKGKYLVSGMLRRDASTRFNPDNRVGYFPSATAGWIISEEGWFDSETFNFLKLRGSYGILGNDEAGGAQFYRSALTGEATYVFDNQLVNGTAPGRLANPSSGWEEAEKINFGLDLRLLNNKIDITADIFREERKDLLIAGIPVSGILGGAAPGAGAPTINAGTTRNQGAEFAINYKENFSDDVRLNVSYNFTYLENEVTEVNGTDFLPGGAFGVGQPQPARMQEGFPIGYFYGYRTNGIFQNQSEVDAHPAQNALGAPAQPGDIRYVDINGDGVINTDDRTNIGDPIPDFTMGLNLNFTVKNFDFTAYTYASLGNEMVRNYERNQPNVNRHAYYLERWRGPGTSNEVPRLTTAATSNGVFSDFYVEDASYVRIQNAQIGYSLPADFLDRVGIDKLRIYVAGNNLYTFTDYKGFDPSASTGEAIGGGIDYGFYPVPRTYMFGLNLNF